MSAFFQSLLASTSLRWFGLAGLVLGIFSLLVFLVLRKKEGQGYFSSQYKIILLKVLPYLAIIAGVVFIFSASYSIAATPKVVYPTDPALSTFAATPSNPVMVKFGRFVDQKSLKYEISPALPGQWKLTNSIISGQATLKFTPDQSPEFGARYTISLTDIKNIASGKKTNYLFSFQFPELPRVTSSSVSDGDQDILPNQAIQIGFDNDLGELVDYQFETIPAVPLEVAKNNQNYTVTSKEIFKKGSSYTLRILQTPNSVNYKTGSKTAGEQQEIWRAGFTIMSAPGIKSYSPAGEGALTDVPIVIEFRQDMDKNSAEKAFSILPNTTGATSWEGNRKMIFQPTQLSKNQKYTVTIAKTAVAADNTPFEEDVSFDFTTIGYVRVSSFSPANKATNVSIDQTLSITFNQAVDHVSAESKFSISPTIAGNFSWSGNTLKFSHGSLEYSKAYTINIAAGVKTVYGLDSDTAFAATFTTQSQSVTLNVPAYKQAHMYSCEIAAARSALAFKGKVVSESDIIAKVGTDTTPWSGTWSADGAVWGDPETGIVGDLDGKANNIGWGYGTHWQPIAKALSAYGISNETKSSWNVSGLAQSIVDGNPVIIWWVNGVWPSYNLSWKTPAGKTINAVNGMHVVVVKGFAGTVTNPTSFTVTDSGYGYPGKAYDVATFKAKWGWFGNTGIIVK